MIKIYIHHFYSYEVFWYFFHGVNIDPRELLVYTEDNRRNKNKNIKDIISISTSYKNKKLNINFVSDKCWDKNDGYHVFDYNIFHIENNNTNDRGYSFYMGKDLKEIFLFLNLKYKKIKNKLSFFYIDWEPTDDTDFENLNNVLNKDIDIFLDDTRYIKNNQFFSYTHILSSFIFPNTINLREYYYFADFIKYKNDYKCKINFPIRRITPHKLKIFKELQKLNNKSINCTISEFTIKKQFEPTKIEKWKIDSYNFITNIIGEENIIKKREYNLGDWGGEWNDNNMSEYMYKLLTLSEVVIVFETTPSNWINEKSISHILASKPFIPVWRENITFYEKLCDKYNLELPEYPIKYKYMNDLYDFLDKITQNDEEWNDLVEKLYEFSNALRSNIIQIIHNNNDYLDYLIDKENLKKSVL